MKHKNQPLISVIVPVYNIEKWLTRCVNSICAQTYANLEIILVNDGSTDRSGELAEELAGDDNRIRVFHKENGGTSSARNMGIEKAEGEYIGFVDSDDYIDPLMYESLLNAMEKESLMMTQVSRDELDHEGNRLKDVCIPPEKKEIWGCEYFIRELLLHRGDCSFDTRLTKASLLKEERFPEGVLNEDFHLLIRLLPKVGEVAILSQQYYHVFRHLGSNTRKKGKNEFSRVFMDIVDNADMMEELVRKQYPSLQREALRFALFQRLDYMLHIPIDRMVKEDIFYCNVKKYLRRNIFKMLFNPYLTPKNKVYLFLLSIAPRTVRRVHAYLRRSMR